MIIAVRGLAVAAALIGVLGLGLGRESGVGPALSLGAAVWGLGWLTVGWVLVAGGTTRAVALLATAAGVLLIASSLSRSGWVPVELAWALGSVALVGVLPVLWIWYPSRPLRLVITVCVPIPIGFAAAVLLWPQQRGLVISIAGLVVPLAVISAVWWRLERGAVEERETVLWNAYGVGGAALLTVPLGFVGSGWFPLVLQVLLLLGACAVAVIGVISPAAVDIRLLIVTSVVYAVTVMVILAVFSGTAAVIQLSTGTAPSVGSLALIAAGAAALFVPIRRLLTSALDRMLFGDRQDTITAAYRFGEELSAAGEPLAALRALREVLWLPYVAVETDSVAAVGELPAEGIVRIPLVVGAARLGTLVIGLRAGERRLSRHDRDVLRVVTPALAHAIQARALAEELQRSRNEVVTVVEDERRRLSHDLHDGLGPTLTGIAYAADAARNQLRTDVEQTDQLLASIRGETGNAITEVRRLVVGLRPSVLDQLGLVGALRQHSTHLHTAAGRRLDVTLGVPDPMPPMTAATEVAAYLIVSEALTNVARHAGCDTVEVTIVLDGPNIVIMVEDRGPVRGWQPGIGLASMRERAELLGGTFEAGADPRGGRVRVTLPIG
ncbi:MAG TPA: sensor histidine kinase [Microlunatus sp.]